jgi:glycosyltransferase involved in cell wall biosynthesis
LASNGDRIDSQNRKIAIVHDWLVTYAGSEKVLEQILLLYQNADLYSLINFIPEEQRGFLLNKKVRTSFLQHFPYAKEKYRHYLLLMPLAIKQFDLSGYDLVISSSHAVAKGVKTGHSQLHICYCHTPMRYAWDLSSQYLRELGFDSGFKGVMAKAVLSFMRRWDFRSARGVNHFIANSEYVAERIKRIYKRSSTVIYPPVDIESFELCTEKEDFYLTASRMVPYKKIDLIVEAFSKMSDKRLVVIGDGPEMSKVKAKARKNIEIIGYQEASFLKDYMQKARAFVFAAEEDFGIVPVEAQACGTPVIAYGKGGVLETVREWKTGVFFRNQSPDSLMDAVRDFERRYDSFDPQEIRKNAERFGQERFRKEFREFIKNKIREFRPS